MFKMPNLVEIGQTMADTYAEFKAMRESQERTEALLERIANAVERKFVGEST